MPALLTGAVGLSGLVGHARVAESGATQAAIGQARASTTRVAALQHQVRGNVWFALTAASEDSRRLTPDATDSTLQPEIRLELDRMRGAVHDATVSSPPPFTVSFGVVDSTAADSIDALLRFADGALYRAKDAGRNRVVVADPTDEDPRSAEPRPTPQSDSAPPQPDSAPPQPDADMPQPDALQPGSGMPQADSDMPSPKRCSPTHRRCPAATPDPPA